MRVWELVEGPYDYPSAENLKTLGFFDDIADAEKLQSKLMGEGTSRKNGSALWIFPLELIGANFVPPKPKPEPKKKKNSHRESSSNGSSGGHDSK